ncbi:MAG: hypothetical protein LBV50_04505 [Novosphingobium sp.]|jgi:hypothetical protein|nr:hypothetical protein [Novosphingobium sp.]
MINPRPTEVIENLIATLDSIILPRLKEADVLSAATTTRHMLRYVLNQMWLEPVIFAAELPKLEGLLDEARQFFHAVGASEALAIVATALAHDADDVEPGHEGIAMRVGKLREGIHGALRQLIDHRADWSGSTGYDDLRKAIRDYLAWQNIEEAKIVAPAFYGQGARR